MFTEAEKTLIKELGLQDISSEEDQARALQDFYDSLQMKVGMALEDKLSDEQLIEFEKIAAADDDQADIDWLKKAIPDYEQIVAEETAKLKQEINQSSAELRAIMDEADNE
jgi:hypothetical protein